MSAMPPSLPAPFRRLAWSNFAAQSAEQIALAAAPLVAVVMLGAGAGETGLLQTVLTLPNVIFAIPAGLAADRVARGRLMAAAELARALALAAIVVALWAGALTLPLLMGLGFVAACGTVVFSVAAPALVPSLVPPALLSLANARIELARTAAFAAGPALGGVLVGFTGAPVAFAAACALSLVAANALRRVAEPPRLPAPGRHPVRDIAEGAGFVFRHRLLAPVFVTQVGFNTAFFMIFAVLVPHAATTLGLSPPAIGLLLSCYGIGMVLGALGAPRLMASVRFGAVVGIGPLCGLAASVLVALSAVWPSAALAGAGLFLFGIGPILWVISTTTLRQAVTPASLLGRVSAIVMMTYGARPLGSALGALVASLAGTATCLWVAVAGFAAQALVIWLSPAVRLEARPAMP